MTHKKAPQSPWYKEGLSFKCTGCGKCCSGPPGYVWLSDEEVVQIADYLNLAVDLFKRKYVRLVRNRMSLVERKVASTGDYECIFLKDKQCSIYPVRPTQCRTFPWWPENLTSLEAWKAAAKECEGIHIEPSEDVPIVPKTHIEEQREIHQSQAGDFNGQKHRSS